MIQRLPYVLFGILLGGTLLYVAVPRLVAAILNVPGNAVLTRLQYRLPVTAATLPILRQSREDALAWVHDGRTLSELGLAEERMSLSGTLPETERLALIDIAIGHQQASLALAPHSAEAWLRLAIAEMARPGLSADQLAAALDHLRMSTALAPYDRRLSLDRAGLYLSVWPAIPPDDLPAVTRQILMLWDEQPDALVVMTEEAGTTDRLRPVIGRSIDDLQRLQRAVARARATLSAAER